MTVKAVSLWITCAFLLIVSAVGVARGDEPPELQQTLEDENAEGADLWIYNDIALAMQIAKEQNKPIFVTFRCVPCEDCRSFDAEVAQGNEGVHALAQAEFVCVRQVEMKGVDLTQFQFDYDLNWAAMFINADGTVYARYGTQSAEGPDAYNSMPGLEATMQRVLQLHAGYPGNQEELAGKRGPQKPYKTALEMPGIRNREELAGATTRRNCVHCHNLHDAENETLYEEGRFTEDHLWRYPLPENIGLTIDASHGRLIESLESGSPAADSGLRAGEELTHLNGQVITSVADIQWVLHHLPNDRQTLTAVGSESGAHELTVGEGWKVTDPSWRGSLWSVRPRLRVWMPPLSPNERRDAGIDAETPALLVKWINRQQPGGRSAFEAGLRQGDVVLELNGEPISPQHQRFSLDVKLNYDVGDTLPLTVLRNGRRREVRIPLVE